MSKIWEPSGGVDDKVLFGMYPEDLDAQDRQELYAEAFEDIVKSYSTMATACRYQAIIDEMIDDETRAQLIADTQAAMEAVSIARTAMDSISESSTAMDPISESIVAMEAVIDSDDIALPAVVESQIAMDAVSTSQTAMDAVSDSQTAMDAVSDSQTAMDAVSVSQTAMDAVSDSQTAMDAVSDSQTAMDAVSDSQTAMDAVSVSTVAMEAVAASALAMDAVIASDDIALPTIVEEEIAMDAVSTSDTAMDAVSTSETAMDAVGGSQTAMDAVAGSQTAMDAVAASIMPRSAVFDSDYAVSSLWAASPGARTILEEGGSPTLPHTYDDSRSGSSGTHLRIEDGSDISLPGNATSALEIEVVDSDDPYRRGLTLELDLSNATTLEFEMRADSVPDSRIDHGVEVDGSTLFSNSGNSSWTNRSVDVSEYSGTHDVLFFTDTDSRTGGDWMTYFSNINLI
ncbi:repeat-containing tail fiber protein [Natrialba phage PhiCh1]|uniref:Repeat-containing tail fiber protein n=1 Tax=Natrialba phage PhiCh1 TaxID=114777 RepID=A0A481W4N3_9CAUD|nr:repeat-containing tail fiber protein [Natrialba phage PhiCh1]QBJ01213.1 repeat-containing tail fiber protein [Natrialba phage PhiCh1]